MHGSYDDPHKSLVNSCRFKKIFHMLSSEKTTPLNEASAERLRAIDYVLTDVDDTLTHGGRLPPETFRAMSRLQKAGIKVIPVTAAPAGWCDQMVRMWPVDAVIAENGGLYFHIPKSGHIPDIVPWLGREDLAKSRRCLEKIRQAALTALPNLSIAADQPFRLTSLAFNAPADRSDLLRLLKSFGCSTTVNNLWVLAWFGAYTKLEMSRRLLAERFGLDIDAEGQRLIYSGDSINDEPMFKTLPNSVGVATVTDFLPQMSHGPTWITPSPGGYGFAEMAQALLDARSA
jgi:hypothetical protein